MFHVIGELLVAWWAFIAICWAISFILWIPLSGDSDEEEFTF